MNKKDLPWATKGDIKFAENEVKTEDLSPFSYVRSIQGQEDKKDFSREEVEKAYIPFLTNRFISMNPAYTILVNEINMYPDTPKEAHFTYFYSFIPKKKPAYAPYISKVKEDDIKDYIKKYFEFGTKDLIVAMKLLTDEQKEEIREKYSEGRVKR